MLKHFITTNVLLFSASIAHAADAPLCSENTAACLLSLTGGPASSPIECDSADQTIVYTVFNDSDVDVDLAPTILTDASDTSPGSSVTIDTNPLNSSCYETSPPSVPAEDFCTITVTIDIVDCAPTDFPEFIVRELVVVLDFPQAPLTADIDVEITGPAFLTVLPGVFLSSFTHTAVTPTPLLVAHTSNQIWENIDTSVFAEGQFKSATCVDDGICIAVGTSAPASTPTSLIYSSQDGGITWDTQSLPALLPEGELRSVACNADGTRCVAVGADDTLNVGLIMGTIDGGINWGIITNTDTNATFVDVACPDVNNCRAAAQVPGGGEIYKITLVKNQNPTLTWASYPNSQFNATACAGPGTTASDSGCTIVGQNTSSSNAEIWMTFNDSTSTSLWSTVAAGNFYDTACTTEAAGTNRVCTAVGQTGSSPMLYQNIDYANFPNAWTNQSPVVNAALYGTSCASNSTKTVCVAVGRATVGLASVVYVNTDITNTPAAWTSVPAPNGVLNGVACTVTNTDKIACTAAGIASSSAPLIFSTVDVDSVSWSIPPITSTLPSNGCFNGAGAAGANSNNAGC